MIHNKTYFCDHSKYKKCIYLYDACNLKTFIEHNILEDEWRYSYSI